MKDYAVGVMQMEVEGRDSAAFGELVQRAVAEVDRALADLSLRLDPHTFEGPHLTPVAGAYSPLDFLHLGIAEKLERRIPFLLIVTEVDLAASTLAYTLALPSQLTNVGIVSTRRLDPEFWGEDADPDRAVRRLAALMLHTLGHVLNLGHHPERANAMFDFEAVEDLDRMGTLTAEQLAAMERNLPREARERVSPPRPSRFQRWRLSARWLLGNLPSVGAAVARANPIRLIGQLPTMMTAALSAVIVLFFSAEMWDVGSTLGWLQLALFSVGAVVASTVVLYRAFAFGSVLNRDRLLAESTVVTSAAVLIALTLTMLAVWGIFFGATYLGVLTVFPERLMETWPTVDPATRLVDHLKLAGFLASIGVLAGSLGGRADSRDLVRHVLFLDEET